MSGNILRGILENLKGLNETTVSRGDDVNSLGKSIHDSECSQYLLFDNNQSTFRNSSFLNIFKL